MEGKARVLIGISGEHDDGERRVRCIHRRMLGFGVLRRCQYGVDPYKET